MNKALKIVLSRSAMFVSDSGSMWEDHEEEEDDNEDEEFESQLLSDLISSNKYGEPKRIIFKF